MVRHHLDPEFGYQDQIREKLILPEIPWLEEIHFVIQSDSREMARQRAKLDIRPSSLSETELSELVAFLKSLTGKSTRTLPLGRPSEVPSGLPVD